MRLQLSWSQMSTSILGGAKPFESKKKEKKGAPEADMLSRNLQHWISVGTIKFSYPTIFTSRKN